MADTTPEPWITLASLIEAEDTEGIVRLLDDLPTGEIVHAVSHLDGEIQARLLAMLPAEEGAHLAEVLPDAHAAWLLQQIPPGVAAVLLEDLASDEQADLLAEMEEANAETILSAMQVEEAEEARSLSRYPGDVAGGLMITEYLSYPETSRVSEVLDDLRRNAEEYRDYDVQYAYVESARGKLVGVVPLRELLLGRGETPVRNLMIRNPRTVSVNASLEDLRDLFEEVDFFGIPAVDAQGRLEGVVTRSGFERAEHEASDSTYRKSQGIVGGEELRSMPLLLRSRRRLSWLSVNIVLNVIAASIIAFYEETLQAVIALAVFLPIISDMSGCSGNQAVAVSMREMTLGLANPRDVFRVWGREITVGLLNGAVLGLLLAGTAWAWKGNPWLGLVVGTAMAVNTMVAVSIGGTVPLLLKRLGKDPALASGPILTTVTDMCGFFLVLGLAAVLLARLTGA